MIGVFILFSLMEIFSSELLKNRVYTVGENTNGILCNSLIGSDFQCEDKKLLTGSSSYYPGGSPSVEILEMCSTDLNTFFMMKNGDIYGVGSVATLGTGGGIGYVYEPEKISFSTSISLMLCSYNFALFCSSDYDCFAFGIAQDYDISYVGNDPVVYVTSPTSILPASDNYYDVPEVFFNSTVRQNSPIIVENVVIGARNIAFVFKNESTNERFFYGRGNNNYGALFTGYGRHLYQMWDKGILPSSVRYQEIKFSVFLNAGVAIFIVTADDRFFFSGRGIYSTCLNYYDAGTYFNELQELPPNEACYTDSTETDEDTRNELVGKNIQMFDCSWYQCVALTSDNKFYSWVSSSSGTNLLMREFSSSYCTRAPRLANTTLLDAYLDEKKAHDIEIESIQIQQSFFFIIVLDSTESKKRIFGGGKDDHFNFAQSDEYYMAEVFQDYEFSSYMTLSKGAFQSDTIFVQDVPFCGDTGNDTCSGRGTCYGGDAYSDPYCVCDEGYGGDQCEYIYCFDILSSSESVCYWNGDCIAPDTCECSFSQKGVEENCQIPSCYLYSANDSRACSGQKNGRCVGDDHCQCSDGFSGLECEKRSPSSNVLGTVLGVTIPSVIVVALVLGLLFCLCVCLICCLVVLAAIPVFLYVAKNKKKMDSLGTIKNIDLIMEEQRLEEQMDIAHLRIRKELFQIEMKEIRLKKIIGQGGSNSTVYLISWRNQDAAFKCFKTRALCSEQNNFDDFEKEVEILGSISHPNIIRYFGACLDPSRTGYVMEYCPNGDLNCLISVKNQKKEVFEYSEKIRMLIEIASAMSFLHSKKIIHRDLKPENVLIDAFHSCKVMDFGASKFYESTKMNANMTKGVGTSYFMSPEIVLGKNYTKKVDVFSFGILMFVMLTEQMNPYPKSSMNVEYQVANDPSFRPSFNDVKKEIDNDLKILCKKCWSEDEEIRPSFEDISTELRTIRKR